MNKMVNNSKLGLIVAFVGIDGSGKSTVIKELRRRSYPNHISGIKEMYFGNKDFLLPGLNWLFQLGKRKKGSIGAITKGLAAIDVKFRALPALIAKRRRKLVFCDRYYYDQQVGDPVASFTNNKILKKLFNPFIAWMPLRPDMTIYLKIDPEIAYSRQHGRSLDQEISSSREYDELFKSVKVTVIDANSTVEQVVENTVQAILLKLGDNPE